MNKELLSFLQKREKIILNFSNEIALTKKINLTNRANDVDIKSSENGFEMILKISTETKSPVQRDWLGNWDEIISRNCFDNALQKNKELFCFLDHNIDIAHTLASTRNNTMVFEKSNIDNSYIARIQLDKNIEQHKDLIEKIRSGLVNSNSFIFIPEEVEYIENENRVDGTSEMTVIHKRGELISVDPVIMPFYPTNEIEFLEKGKPMGDTKIKKETIILSREESESEKDDNFKKDKDEDKAEKDSENNEKEDAAIEEDKADEEETEAVEDSKKEKKSLILKKGSATVEIDYEGLSDEELSKKVQEVLDAKKTEADNNELDDTSKADTQEPDTNMGGEKINSETESKREKQILKNNEVIKKMNDNLKSNQPNIISNIEIRNKALKKSVDNWNKPLPEDYTNSYIQRIQEILLANDIDEYELCRSINTCSASLTLKSIDDIGNLLKRAAIDGSTYSTGLAYISIINDPEVKTELERALPEIKGADFIQIDNLDIVQKDLLIPSSGVVVSIPEGQDSTSFNGSTVSIQFKPTRYALEHKVNIKLPNFPQTMDKDTLNGKNGITTAIRTAFYQNLVTHKNQTFASLIPGTNPYTGGITKDSLTSTVDLTKLTISDFDNLINLLQSRYGTDEVKNMFVFLMHPNTRSFLMTNLRKEYNAVWVANAEQNTFRGIDIVTAPMFPGQVNSTTGVAPTGTLAFVLCRKDTIAVRGFNFVIEDNPYINMSKGLATRYQNTRGEMKLYDPYINTYAIQVGTVTTFTVDKLALMSDDEIIDINNKINADKEFAKQQTRDARNHIDGRIKEIEKTIRETEKNKK